ncbi:MAG: hypothetical protein ACI84C_002814 [Flavobacteriales bacterium]|jgi:hypothetical protein
MKIFLSALISLLSISVLAQDTTLVESERIIQFSGVAVTGDSLMPVPLVTVFRQRDSRGTVADYNGFYSLPAHNGDTIIFSSIGYRTARFIIPEDLEDNRLSIVQFLQTDTINLPVTFIYPWPAPLNFKEEFLALNLPDDEIEIARKNLESIMLYEKTVIIGADGSENYKMAMRRRADQLYYQGGIPPITILNPINWAKFIQAWKNGDLKKQ